MSTRDVCLGVIVALILIFLALYARRRIIDRRREKIAEYATSLLFADIKKMLGTCEVLQKTTQKDNVWGIVFSDSCRQLSRALEHYLPANLQANLQHSNRHSKMPPHIIYSNLASPDMLIDAARSYSMAAQSAHSMGDFALSHLLGECSMHLRRIVNSIHRLGSALELE